LIEPVTGLPDPSVIRRPEDMNATWLTSALTGTDLLTDGDRVASLAMEPVGTGQMGDTVRISFSTDQGAARSVVAKFASADEQSRATGLMTRAYEIEVGFYRQVADRVRTRMPGCHYARCEADTGWFVLLLDDLDAVQGEQLIGCDPAVAEAALVELAALHGPTWADADIAGLDWLQRGGPEADEFLAGLVSSLWPGFVDRYGDRLDAEHLEVGARLMAVLGPWLEARPTATTVTHGDFRLDNLLFSGGDPRPYVVDWQTAAWGSPAADVSYFLGGSLTVEDRRIHGEALLASYHRALSAHGVDDYSLDRLGEEVRTACFGGLVMSVGASMLVQRTDRGDDMFVTSVARYAQQALDLDAVATLAASHG
jgi:hypothetical protein